MTNKCKIRFKKQHEKTLNYLSLPFLLLYIYAILQFQPPQHILPAEQNINKFQFGPRIISTPSPSLVSGRPWDNQETGVMADEPKLHVIEWDMMVNVALLNAINYSINIFDKRNSNK